MARKLSLGGKSPQTGNKVSHSNRKTKRKWMPNMQKKALFSNALGRTIQSNISTSLLRTLDRVGGIDNYLLRTDPDKLTAHQRRLRLVIERRVAA
ncbi:MAG: 50S ribosomal protein L28 [Magnetococcales bacterium]|nr:50S ribosomal protein L28 [Magnetococcales bacterium]